MILLLLLFTLSHAAPQCDTRPFREQLGAAFGADIRQAWTWPPDCARLDRLPTAEEFAELRLRGQPVVIGNAWGMFGEKVKQWRDPEYLRQKYGSVRARASYFDTQKKGERFGMQPVEGGKFLRVPYKVERTLAEVIDFNRTDRLLFIEQCPIFSLENGGDQLLFDEQGLPQPRSGQPTPLYREWRQPAFATSAFHQSEVNLWLGRIPKGAPPKESPTHYDPTDNLMLQLRGTKTWHLYHAFDAPNIYPQYMRFRYGPNPDDPAAGPTDAPAHLSPIDASQDNFSPVNPAKPDFKRFPRSAQAHPMTCQTKPGDALFMPAFTWHNVVNEGERTDDPRTDGLSIGVNVWFQGDMRFMSLFESAMAMLQGGRLTEKGVLQGDREVPRDEDVLARPRYEQGSGDTITDDEDDEDEDEREHDEDDDDA